MVLAPEQLDAHLALAHELADQLTGRADVLDTLPEEISLGVDEWMWNLATVADRAGRVDEAVAVSDALAGVHLAYRGEHLANAALVLARAGRDDEARPRLEALRGEMPDDRLVAILSAEAYQALGDAGAAEDAYRLASDLALAGGEPDEVEDSLEVLASFQDSTGRSDEAGATRERLRAWRGGTGSASVAATAVASKPRVGRNQPCPCGGRELVVRPGRERPVPTTRTGGGARVRGRAGKLSPGARRRRRRWRWGGAGGWPR